MIAIRSYRQVFDLERRVYRVDSLRLNPSGVPVRGLVYFGAAVLACALLVRLPLLGTIFAALPWYLRDVAVPAATAAFLAGVSLDGRTFHVGVAALVCRAGRPAASARFEARPRGIGRWRPPAVVLLPDGSEPTMRRMLCIGPATAVLSGSHQTHELSRLRAASLGVRSAASANLRWRALRPALVLAPAPRRQRPGGVAAVVLGPGAGLLTGRPAARHTAARGRQPRR